MESDLFELAAERARAFRATVDDRPVGSRATVAELEAALGGELSEGPTDPHAVIAQLADGADRGLVATAGPRFFGFVVGGSLPVAVAADWLTSTWDQNAGIFVLSPAAAVVEDVAGAWLKQLLGIPSTASHGFVTGGQMANFTGLAAARHHLLARHGWDVEERGLYGAPELHVVVGAEAHVTIHAALQFLGLGRNRVVRVPADRQGRMLPAELARILAGLEGPILLCAQAGNINSGAFDPLEEVIAVARRYDAWVHVDGAFGLWASASPRRAPLARGVAGADSWACDAHKWLNVPYDCGLAFTAHPDAHRAATAATASYLVKSAGPERDPEDWTPEFSRRARAFPTWAALRSLGRAGVADLVDRACAHARRFAEGLGREPRISVENEVVLNQVAVRFAPPGAPAVAEASADEVDRFTREVIRRVQEDGTCWLGGSTWRGNAILRISIVNHATSESDVDRSLAAILRAAEI